MIAKDILMELVFCNAARLDKKPVIVPKPVWESSNTVDKFTLHMAG